MCSSNLPKPEAPPIHTIHATLLLATAVARIAHARTCTATLAQTEGPYYRSPNPETQLMRRGTDGLAFTLRGRVVDTSCNAIPWTWVAL